MKKMLKTGKKTLSVIMAVMMVLTAWVWVAPTKASAATAGNYKVRITWQVNNTKDYSNSFTGTETEDGARAGIILYYKSNNGSGTQSSMYWCLDSTNYGGTYVSAEKSTGNTNSSTGKDYYCVATIAGFPTALYGMADSDNILDKGQYTVSKIEVYNNTKSAYDTLWAGKGWTDTSTEKKWWKITADGDGTVTTTGNDSSNGYASTTTETWNFPTPTTATTWSGVSAMTIPKTGTATQDIELVANDQYGVEMFNPTWSVKGSVCGTTGISVDPTTSSQTTTIKLTNAANVSSSTDTQTGTITATWSTLGSLSETFTITDSYYTATFNYKSSAGADTSTKKYGYHGDTITAPTAPEYDSGDNHYKFSKWSPTFASTITKDVTYTAQYTSTFVGADYSAVNEAIAAADAIKANYDTEYELKYTHASRLALDSAINAVVTGLGRTKQDVVDGYAQAINDAIAALDPNKFDVIFLDKDGAILLYEKDVEYKESVTAPSYSDKYYDSTNHYTFTGWDTDEYASVVDDLVIQPVFTAEAHTFTAETVPSTCVQKGATKYICSCGYSYIDGETDYGDHVWETEFTTDLEPTCTVAGSKSIHCTLCDAQKDITVIDPLGHQWSSQSIAVEASCGKIGIMTKVCDDCGVCEHTIIPALEHDYAENTVAPTCTTKGYTEYTCQRADCGHSYRDNYTDVIAHTYGAWETVSEAHCGVAGVKKQTCTECGHVNIGSIDALTHDELDSLTWDVVLEDTCEYAGYRTKTCSKCNNVIAAESFNDITDHDYKTVTTPATCTQAGYTVTTCNRDDCGYEKTTVLQPTGHKFENEGAVVETAATCTSSAYKTYNCDNCDYSYVEHIVGSTAIPHDFTGDEEIIETATCVTDGKKTVQCKHCDATTEVILPKLGHRYGSWEVVKAATNTEDGQWKRVCANNAEHIEYLTIPKGGHTWGEGTQTLAPTCTTTGTMVYACTAHTDCGVTLEVTVPVAQHTVAQRTAKQATCTEKGSVEVYCTACDVVLETIETPVVPHTLDNGTEVAATCTTSGYTLYSCTAGCDFSYKEYNEDEKVKDHEYKAEETLAPTCTTEGTMTYTCACGASYTAPISPTGHSFVEDQAAATDATCTALATKTYKCSCGESYTEHYGTLAAHKFDTLVKTVPATNDSLGYEERKCACGLTEITILEATGTHVFNEKIESECVAPTCTENGTDVYKCTAHTNCTAKSSVLVPRLGHTAKAVYNAPTCIAQGSSKAVCETCDEILDEKEIPVIGYHDFSGEGVKVDATCTNAGTMTYTCQTDGCNETKVEAIHAKGHTFETVVNDAKCGEKGSVVTSCTTCNDPKYTTTVELGAKGHIWKDAPESTEAAECEKDGSETYECENCDETNVVVIPKLGHKWSEWEMKPATTTEDGSWSRTCSNCNDTENLVIPRGHNLVKDTENSKAASCKQEGKEIYICESHTDCGVKIEVTLDKLQHTVAQREIEATCKAEGSVEAYCTVCKDVLSTEAIPVKAHNYVAGEVVEPTCTTSGYTVYKCDGCNDTYNVYNASKPAKGHNLVEGASTANCTEAGTKTLTCSVCQNYTVNVNVPALGHDYVEDTNAATAATCAAPATKTYKCSRCADSYKIFDGEKATEHTWGKETIVEAATATSLGYKTIECSVCGQIKAETIPATGDHKFTVETADKKDPTCTEDGYIVYACATNHNCGLTSKVTVPATGHKEALDYKAATCDEKGYARMVCSVETCKAVISNQEIPALGHLYGDGVVTNATCNTKGSIAYSCTRCTDTKTVEIPENANAHQYKTVVTPATCYSKGSVVTKCDLCGDVTTNDELPVIEHTWNSGVVTNAADCENEGLMTYTCTVENCGTTKEEKIAKLGHDWGEWAVSVASTNTAEGEMKRTCKRDGCDAHEIHKIPAGGHELVVDTEKSTAATCSAVGTTVYKCSAHNNCGITVTIAEPMLQHELEMSYETTATCTVNGEVVTKCTKCDAILLTTVIPATGHSYTGEVTTAATCTTEGIKTYTCSKCNGTYTETLPKLQHVYVEESTTAPTCTSSGYKTYKCSNAECDSSYVVITEAAKGHDFDEKVAANVTITPATCTTDGSKTVKCKDCDEKNIVVIPKTGHNYVKGTVVTANCTTAGTEVYTCACGDTYTKLVETSKGHTYGEWEVVTAATADKNGVQKRICACGDVEYGLIPPIGNHKFKETITTPATCTSEGLKTFTCESHTDCSANYTEKIPATGHKENLVYEAATCTKEGSTKIVCDTCKNTISDVTTIPALGHLFDGEGEYVAATCKKEGSMTYTCGRDNCDEKHITTIAVNPDAHKLKRDVKNATCKEAGSITVTCENGCDYNQKTELPMLQHSWDEWVIDKASTNTSEGLMTRTCSNGCTEEVKIPAGGHTLTETGRTNSSCTVPGSVTYECKVNHTGDVACGIKVVIDLPLAAHTPKTEVVNTSCTTEGTVKTYCSVCDAKLADDITLGKTQHEFEVIDTVGATCTMSGYKVYKCKNCYETYNEINGDALGHKFTEKASSTASCTTEGVLTLKCACGATMTTDVPALGHDYQKISTTVATCAAAATETYKCLRCDAQYTISVGEKAKEHSYSENWTTVQEATPTSIGYRTRTCSVCGQLDVDTIEATGEHKFETGEIVKTVPATCTENGYVERKCSVHTDCGETANITIPATGHTEEAIAAVAATCEKEGSSAGSKCSVCGTTLVAPVTLPALGHNWGNEKVTPATCQAEGKIEYTCTRDCGATETRVIAIDKNAHNLVTTVEQATCTAEGKVTVSCQNGDCTFSEVTATIPAKGHTFTGAETTVSKATCTNDGEKTVKCANCDEVNTVIIPKLGHKMMAGEKVAPTCTTSGYTPYTCENGCGESYRVYDETVKKHNYVQVEGSSTAACIAGGTVTMKCSHCDAEITAEVPALGHSYGEWTTVNPTAEAEGSKTRECDRCDATETVILPKLGHDMVKDEAASTPATCTEKGTDVYVCTTHTGDAACGYTYRVELPAKGHSYDEGTVKAGDEATCDKDGVKTFTCACGDEYTQVIPMTGHKLSTTVTEATCKDAGSVVTECTNSGCDHKVEKVLAKLPHTISVSYAYPGCDKDGYVKEKCDKCDYENTISTAPKLGHSYTGEETVTKEATCLEKGEKTVKCSRCDATVTVEIPAKGHSYVAGAEVPATCTESGYIPYGCACGSSYKELVSNPNGHKWNTQPEAGSVIATCVVDGKVTYKCQFCDAKNEVITPKFGHSWSAWEVVINPTATVDGVQMRKCLRGCGATESVIIPALGGTTTYTVSFVVDGKTVATQTVNHGSAATAPEISNKAPDAKYHYSFIWDTDFTKVTSDLTVAAVFTPAAHSFGEWVIDLEANCNRDGARHRVCSCGYTESEVIPATEHDVSEIKEEKAATCTENGYKVVVCKNCGATERQTIKRLGHLMNYFEGVEATCDRDGVAAHYTCSRCGKSFEDRAGKVELTNTVIKKRYHTYVVVEGSDPTCTKEGVTDYRYCTACGYTQHPEKIPATGHADVNNDNTCDKCGATYMQGGEVICSCRCHKNGFFNELIYKILSFFWRLFGSNKSCECGKVHY